MNINRMKIYAVVTDGEYFYLPVKAKINPYSEDIAYLAELPNFFGGTVEDDRGHAILDTEITRQKILDTLIKEVEEESQGIVRVQEGLAPETLTPFYLGDVPRGNGDMDYYNFYIVRGIADSRRFLENNGIGVAELEPYSKKVPRVKNILARYESKYVLRFRHNFSNSFCNIWDGDKLVHVCSLLKVTPTEIDSEILAQFEKSETRKAFYRLLRMMPR